MAFDGETMNDNIPRIGDRIRLLAIADDPAPIPIDMRGVITDVHKHRGWMQIEVDWEYGRTLMLTVPPDQFAVVDPSSGFNE
jgi:hypothetical protein